MAEQEVAVVTGANRGIGLAVCRQLGARGMAVIVGARELDRGEEAARELRSNGIAATARKLDVTAQADVDALASWLEGDLGRVDVLVNNAGILVEGAATTLDLALAERAWQVNVLGAWRMANALVPLMRRRRHGRIVNVSSEAGSLASMASYAPAYSVSKAAMNAITRLLASELRGTGILVNSVCPGWVATDMGGSGAPRTPEQGAASVVWAAILPADGPTGGFYRDGRPIAW
jgi:NAD(P)-dependent dehydrogenase (short-subunit alcohol dehydrogenase family)